MSLIQLAFIGVMIEWLQNKVRYSPKIKPNLYLFSILNTVDEVNAALRF